MVFIKGHTGYWTGKKRKPYSKKWRENMSKGRKKIMTNEFKKKISKAMMGKNNWSKGKKLSEEHKRKLSEALKEEKSYKWKGDDVGYRGLHHWVRKYLGEPKKCQFCGKEKTSPKSIHWANKSGKYKRDLTDWISLCVPCHKKYDKTLRESNKIMLTKAEEKYVTEVPAIERLETCEGCGDRFYKHSPDQTFCGECNEEDIEAERGQKDKELSLEDAQRC